MNIFIQIKNSVYNKEYYKSVVSTESFGQSLKYLVKVCLLISLLGVVIMTCFIPSVSNKIKSGMSSALASYPDGLVVSIKDGNASVNQPEPYLVKMPASMTNTSDPNAIKIVNILTINTSEPFNLDKFKEYSTISLLTKKELVVIDGNKGEMKILPLSSFGNVEINKAWLFDKEAYLIKIIPGLAIFVLAMAFIGIFVVGLIGTLIILLFSAFIAWIILKIKGIKVSYKKSYQIALHASTLILIISVFGKLFKPLDNIWIKIIILIVIVSLNFDKISTLVKTKNEIAPE